MLHEQQLPRVPQIRPAFTTQDDVHSQCRCLHVSAVSPILCLAKRVGRSFNRAFHSPPSDRDRPRPMKPRPRRIWSPWTTNSPSESSYAHPCTSASLSLQAFPKIGVARAGDTKTVRNASPRRVLRRKRPWSADMRFQGSLAQDPPPSASGVAGNAEASSPTEVGEPVCGGGG